MEAEVASLSWHNGARNAVFAIFVAASTFISILANVVGIGGGINAPAVSGVDAPFVMTVSVDRPGALLYLSVTASTSDVRQTRSELISLQQHPRRTHAIAWDLPKGSYTVVAVVVDAKAQSRIIDSVTVVRK